MKLKVTDYITQYIIKNNITTIFTLTGGFSMHLNDSFGRSDKLDIYYNHHEQGCGYAATGYSKTNSLPCLVCTTAGCAATNAITPCVVAYQDSLPIFFLSGQGKSHETTPVLNNDTMKLRHYAGADCEIATMVKPITKYSYEIIDVNELDEVLYQCIFNMINGRPGPVWLSIPLDIQGSMIDKNLEDIPIISPLAKMSLKPSNLEISSLDTIKQMLNKAERPLILAGNGIKLGNCKDKFNHFLNTYNIPMVCTYHGVDLIEYDNPLFSGKVGLLGERCGNFTIQNCDLLLVLGCRMAQAIIGYRPDWFSRESKKIFIDFDTNELQKTNIDYDLKVNMDLNTFFDNIQLNKKDYSAWTDKIKNWRNKWMYEMPEDLTDTNGINPYTVLKRFFQDAPENKIVTCSSGSNVIVTWQMAMMKKGDHFLISSQGDMGFELPSAIGAQVAEKEKVVFPIFGDGAFQLNIQELQTIVHYNLPIKIIILNNGGYGAIEITQRTFFKAKFGTDTSSGISFPNTEKIASTYGLKYISISKNEELDSKIKELFITDGPLIFEVFCCGQSRVPKLAAKKNEDGSFTNKPYEDMTPFLSREEFLSEMIVKPVDESL